MICAWGVRESTSQRWNKPRKPRRTVFQLLIVDRRSIVTPPFPVYLKSQKPPVELSDKFAPIQPKSWHRPPKEGQKCRKDPHPHPQRGKGQGTWSHAHRGGAHHPRRQLFSPQSRPTWRRPCKPVRIRTTSVPISSLFSPSHPFRCGEFSRDRRVRHIYSSSNPPVSDTSVTLRPVSLLRFACFWPSQHFSTVTDEHFSPFILMRRDMRCK